ncbi:MAG: hypothetical protein Q4B28_07685 [bacterium]|nr:hypothetical protein [bacterium]
MEEALQGLERIIKELSPEVVKINPQAQEVIHYYHTFCKENGFTPIPQAQKFMDLLAKN